MNEPLPIEHAEEYDHLARHCADFGLSGDVGTVLPDGLFSPGAIDYINADPEAFAQRVKEFAYGRSMERWHLEHPEENI